MSRGEGRTALALLLLLSGHPRASGEVLEPTPDPTQRCHNALAACDIVIKAQDTQIVLLKDGIRAYKGKLDAGSSEIPAFIWVLGGIVVGVMAGGLLRGYR